MKLEILRDEIRIVPEGAADEVYLRSIASKEGQAKAKMERQILLNGTEEILHLVVKPFCCGEGPSRPS
jgi:hypothetical protein